MCMCTRLLCVYGRMCVYTYVGTKIKYKKEYEMSFYRMCEKTCKKKNERDITHIPKIFLWL